MFNFFTTTERPKSQPMEKHPADPLPSAQLEEYARLAVKVGVVGPDLTIETFKAVLLKLDIPIFSLPEVIKYMDAKAAKESKHRAGWEWRPLRDKDLAVMRRYGYGFGSAVMAKERRSHGDPIRVITPASDLFSDEARRESRYNHTIPLHALRRIEAIETEYDKGAVSFMVSDYALAPQVIYPDPFLMAVIPNPLLANGVGRFVIDFWNEPGFGFEQMLK